MDRVEIKTLVHTLKLLNQQAWSEQVLKLNQHAISLFGLSYFLHTHPQLSLYSQFVKNSGTRI